MSDGCPGNTFMKVNKKKYFLSHHAFTHTLKLKIFNSRRIVCHHVTIPHHNSTSQFSFEKKDEYKDHQQLNYKTAENMQQTLKCLKFVRD